MAKDDDTEGQQGNLSWIQDMKASDLREVMTQYGKDKSLVYQYCRLETMLDLWENMLSVPIYVTEKPLIELRKRFARKNYDPRDPEGSVKAIALRIKASTQFVREALAEVEEKNDPRQESLFKN
jgi:hypothetical protein